MKHSTCKVYIWSAVTCSIIIIGLVYYYLFASFSTKSDVTYVYIDNDDNIDSVYHKIEPIAHPHCFHAFKM